MKMKHIFAVALVLALCLSFVSCTAKPQTSADADPSARTETEAQSNESAETADTEPETETAQTPAADDTMAQTADEGTAITLQADDEKVKITQGGVYTVTGTLTDGQIQIDAGTEAVTLILSGVELNCSTDNAIEGKGTGTVTIRLAEGTENTVTTPAGLDSYAAISVAGDLTLTGSGTLTVAAASGTGIKADGAVTVESGTYNIYSENNGIKGDCGVTVSGGDFTIACAEDGIKTDADLQGDLTITGGTFRITAGDDAIQSESDLLISGGDFTLTTNGGSAAAPVKAQDGFGGPFGWGDSTGTDSETDDLSAKGLKAEGTLTVSGGTFTLDTYDDGVHTNGDLHISGGTFTIAAGDDAVHADGTLHITGGEITVTYCNEGLEGAVITIDDGMVDITSYDDGINAAGDGEITLTINGGTVTIDAAGDGLDSNGDMYLNGGYILVSGAENSGNGAIDYASESRRELVITGGTLIAAGMSGMAESASWNSTQPSALVAFDSALPAGTEVTVTDESGSVILTFTAAKSFNALNLSCGEFVLGGTYTVEAGGLSQSFTFDAVTVTAGAVGGMGGMGGMGGQPGGMQGGGPGGMGGPGR